MYMKTQMLTLPYVSCHPVPVAACFLPMNIWCKPVEDDGNSIQHRKTHLANDHVILENTYCCLSEETCMLKQLSMTTAMSLAGAVRLVNILSLLVAH